MTSYFYRLRIVIAFALPTLFLYIFGSFGFPVIFSAVFVFVLWHLLMIPYPATLFFKARHKKMAMQEVQEYSSSLDIEETPFVFDWRIFFMSSSANLVFCFKNDDKFYWCVTGSFLRGCFSKKIRVYERSVNGEIHLLNESRLK